MSRRGSFPRAAGAHFTPSPAVDRREVEAIVSGLRRHGPLGPRELSRQVHARLWGPGRFRAALARAQREGRVRRSGRRTYVAT